MPRTPQPKSTEDQVLDEILHEDAAALDRIVQQSGPPQDATKLSQADEDQAWAQTDPQVPDYESFASQLMTQGIPPQQAQNLLVVKLRRPDLQQQWIGAYSQPTQDAEQAHLLARLAQYPFRLSLIEDIDDPEKQVAKAEQMDRRYQKHATAMQEQAMAASGPQGGASRPNPTYSDQTRPIPTPGGAQMGPPVGPGGPPPQGVGP